MISRNQVYLEFFIIFVFIFSILALLSYYVYNNKNKLSNLLLYAVIRAALATFILILLDQKRFRRSPSEESEDKKES